MAETLLSGRREKRLFLKDVLICSLGAYGGPEAHFGVFADQMVAKSKHLTEEELIELIALCSILPGPTSSQTIVVAAFRIGRKVVTDHITALLLLFGGIITYFVRAPWIFPIVLITGGAVSIVFSGQKNIWNRVRLEPPWIYLVIFIFLAAGSLITASVWNNRIIQLFEHFYRYGYLVFGGGQVVVPVMHSELVYGQHYMTNQEFLTVTDWCRGCQVRCSASLHMPLVWLLVAAGT